jgi:integrase
LWAEQEGKEFAQALLGHKDARMTAVYRDSRGAEWKEVKSEQNRR